MKSKTSLAFLTLLSVPATAASVFVDFDQASDLSDFDATTNYSHGASSGVNGTGGLNVDGNGTVSQYTPTTFNLGTAGQSLTLSMDGFLANTGTSGEPAIRVGLTSTPTTTFGSGDYVFGGLLKLGDGSQNRYTTQIGANGNGTLSSEYSLTANLWYRFEAVITASGTEDFTVQGQLFNLGASGTSTPTAVAGSNFTHTVDQMALRGDSTIFAGFKTDNRSGVTVLDNFSVVPEPSSAVLSIVLGLAGLLVRRRR